MHRPEPTASTLAFLAMLVMATPVLGQSEAEIIHSALSAGTAEIAAGATVVDLEGNVLREGDNGYTCMPDMPDIPGNSPMCLDAGWLAWVDAFMSRTEPPPVEKMSFGYMLQGDFPGSNVDPFATGPTDDNEWSDDSGPHVMVLVPDVSVWASVTDERNPGPYVMWRGTPYEHLMIPASKAATAGSGH